ncbi:MAG: glycerophosphodiester phosphodiesterase [Alphaproteobacteria bacterium]|nr:glycerophosphodiester phosphodiesterase [Alphaproteobacteria bacterium]
MLSLFAAAHAQPTIIAHRGFSAVAPENTMAAFEAAAAMGVGFELDVTLSKDGEVVVLHDDTLDRTTTGSGVPADFTLAELQALDAGSWFSPEFAGEKLPTLRDVLAKLGDRVQVDIELKSTKPREPLARAVVKIVEEAGLVDRVLVTSFDPYLLEAVKDANPAIPRGQLTSRFRDTKLSFVAKYVLRHMLLNRRSAPSTILLEHPLARRHRVWRLQRRGYAVWCWTVNEADDMQRMLDVGVDGIITDHPDRLRALIDARR